MRASRRAAAAAAWICFALSLSACSALEQGTDWVRNLMPPAPPPAPPLPPVAAVQPPPPPPPSLPPPPNEIRAEIGRWFTARGYKPFQVTALIEHARIESGFQPCVRGAADLRYTYQWGGLRRRRLQEFAHTQGCPHIDTQLRFADNELRTEPRFACFWRATTAASALAALRRGFGAGSC